MESAFSLVSNEASCRPRDLELEIVEAFNYIHALIMQSKFIYMFSRHLKNLISTETEIMYIIY